MTFITLTYPCTEKIEVRINPEFIEMYDTIKRTSKVGVTNVKIKGEPWFQVRERPEDIDRLIAEAMKRRG